MMRLFAAAFLNRFRAPITGIVEGQVLVLDNLSIDGATIVNCTIFYGGGGARILNSKITGNTFKFFGKAGNTLAFMKGIDQSGDGELIGKTFPGAILHDRLGH